MKLDWKDYVAFVIALLQTALLLIILILIVLLLIVLFIWIGGTIT